MPWAWSRSPRGGATAPSESPARVAARTRSDGRRVGRDAVPGDGVVGRGEDEGARCRPVPPSASTRLTATSSTPRDPGAASRSSPVSRARDDATAIGPGEVRHGCGRARSPAASAHQITASSRRRCDQPARSRPGQAGVRPASQGRASRVSRPRRAGEAARKILRRNSVTQPSPRPAAGRQPDVLDGAGAAPQVGVRKRRPAQGRPTRGHAVARRRRSRPAPRGWPSSCSRAAGRAGGIELIGLAQAARGRPAARPGHGWPAR